MDDNRYPRPATASGTITEVGDLDRLTVLAGDEQTLGSQLELVRGWPSGSGATLPGHDHFQPLDHAAADDDSRLRRAQSARAAQRDRSPRHDHVAIPPRGPGRLGPGAGVIGESLAHFARLSLEAGADGIYFSVRDDWVDAPANGRGTTTAWPCRATWRSSRRPGVGSSTSCTSAARPWISHASPSIRYSLELGRP